MSTAKKYTVEFKEEALKLVTEQGYTQSDAAKNLGISSSTFNTWMIQGRKAGSPIQKATDKDVEIKRLKKENQQLRLEREILKKAAAFFAKEFQ